MHSKNKYDWYIIIIIATMALGTIQLGVISQSVIVGLLCLPSVLKEIHTSLVRQRSKSIVLFIFCWFIWMLLSLFWTIDTNYGYIDLWISFFNMVTFLALYRFSTRANSPIYSLMQGWTLLVALTLPVAIWEFSTGQHLQWGTFNEDSAENFYGTQSRMYAAVTFTNLNTYVTILCSALPIILSSTCYVKYKLFPAIISFITLIVVLMNASRGGMLCIMIDLVIFTIFYKQIHFKYKLQVTLLLIFSLGFFIVNYIDIVLEQLLLRLIESESFFNDDTRLKVLLVGLELVIESLGFGYGVGSMNEAYYSTGQMMGYSHNMVVELFLQYGIVIGVCFLFFIANALIKICRNTNLAVKIYGWLTMGSFIPLMIIDDSYLVRPYFWIYVATLISIYNICYNRK